MKDDARFGSSCSGHPDLSQVCQLFSTGYSILLLHEANSTHNNVQYTAILLFIPT